MNIEQKDISPTRKAILAHFTAEEVSAEGDAVLSEFIQFAKIPGFRPGKANPNMVQKQYAKEINKELKQRLVQKAHEEGLGKSELRIYSIVEIETGEILSGEKASINFSVDIIPKFDLPEYEGVKVKSAPTEADDKEIDQMIGYILGQRAEFKPVDKVIEKGNYVQCSYTGKIGDTLIEEIAPNEAMYGTQKSTWEEAGAENAPGVPAIVEGLIGMQKDETKEVEMDFPADFKIEALAEKKATYEIKVTDIREKILPEMDEAFFESMQVKDEEAFREQIKGTIEQRKENEIANGNRQQIVDHLIQFVTVPLPESGIDSERESILKDFMQKNMQQGVSAEDFEKNKEALHASATQMAESRLKSFIILDMIADKESIKVENDDLNRAIIQHASMTGQKPEAYVKELKKDRSKIDAMQRDIKIGKTLNFLMDKAEITIEEKSESKD
ncbi:MAG: trigger factor [Coraliomargaritaceae bacterium]